LARWRNSFGCADEWKSGRKPDVPVTRDNTLRRSRLFASNVDVRCGSWPCENPLLGTSVRSRDRFGLRPRSQPSAAWPRRCS
jgi:hypothetical protein